MWLLLFASILVHAEQSCDAKVKNAECNIACKTRDYDGGSFSKNSCICFNRVALEKLVDHTIHLENTRLHPHDDLSGY